MPDALSSPSPLLADGVRAGVESALGTLSASIPAWEARNRERALYIFCYKPLLSIEGPQRPSG